MDDDTIEIELRGPREVAARCLALAAVMRRLWLESSIGDESTEALAGEAFDLQSWLRTEGLWETLTSGEVSLLDRPVGELAVEEAMGAAWQAEGLTALAWSLGWSGSLPLSHPGDIAAAVESIPTPWDQTAAWLDRQTLRGEEAIARERERAEIWHWRVHAEALVRAASAPERAEYASAIQAVTQEAVDSVFHDVVTDGDFMVRGTPLTAVPAPDLEAIEAIAAERLRALNWLCGFGRSWDDVPFDV